MRSDRATILHVVHSLTGGGTERALVALLHGLVDARFQHVVVTLREVGSLASKLPDSVGCRPLGIRGPSRTVGFRLARLARRFGAHIIHARNTGCWADAALGALLARRPKLILSYHGSETPETWNGRRRRRARIGMRVGAQFASVSKTGCRWLQETGIPAERITWLPNGVDVQRFSRSRVQWAGIRERVRGEFNLGPSAFVVGCVGSLSPVKRIDLLLEAAARTMAAVPNLFVFIVGDGPLATPLENQCVRLGIRERVRFTSRREDVADLLTVPDVFVGSSDAEGMSNAVLEAMAAGLPVIATRVGDNPILIRDGIDGLIIEPNDPAALESALVRLTRSPAFCAQLGMAAHERAKEFDFPSMVRSYRQFYESLIDFKLQTQRPPRVGANGQSVSGPSAIRWSD